MKLVKLSTKHGALLLVILSIIYFIIVGIYETKKPTAVDTSMKLQSFVATRPHIQNQFYVGSKDASISIMVYMSATCDSCIEFVSEILPILQEEYIATGEAKIYLKPVLSQEDYDQKSKAYQEASAILCGQENGYLLSLNFTQCNNDAEVFDIVKEQELFGIHIQPTLLIGIKNTQNTLIAGATNLNQILQVIRDKEVILGYE